MPRMDMDLDDPNIPHCFFAAWDTAGLLLAELVKRGASKSEIDALREQLLERFTDMKLTEEGLPGLIKIDKPAAEKAMRETVASIFDRIAFR